MPLNVALPHHCSTRVVVVLTCRAVTIGVMEHPDDLLELFDRRGLQVLQAQGVSALQHGWQCARLSAQAHSNPELRLACWLHDIGHLMTEPLGELASNGPAEPHEQLAARVIEPLFGPAVAEPVAMHVAAKRYLVATQPHYAQILSADSRRSLLCQGGPMEAREASRFIAHPLAGDALRLRAWDECAKLADWRPASVSSALSELASLMDEVRSQVA